MEFSTDRLTLRSFEEGDIDEQYLKWLKDSEVTRFSNQRFNRHTLESCASYLRTFQGNQNSFLMIEHKKDKARIGTMTIYRSPHHGTADMGIMMGNREYWGEGLGLEAWNAALEKLLSEAGIRKVTGGTARVNIGMVKIMERSGMVLEAIRQKQELIEGEAIDILYYAKFSEELA